MYTQRFLINLSELQDMKQHSLFASVRRVRSSTVVCLLRENIYERSARNYIEKDLEARGIHGIWKKYANRDTAPKRVYV